MKLNICIDIDGTITDAYYWIHLANKYFNKSVKEEDVTSYEMSEVFGISEEEYRGFYNKYIEEIHMQATIREDVQEVLALLSAHHDLYFITARDQKLEKLTIDFMKKNKIPYDDIYVLGSHYKVDKARELDCDIFIEDNYNNAIQLSLAGFDVILMDTNYNRKPINNKIKRVSSWKEIYGIIRNIELEKVS